MLALAALAFAACSDDDPDITDIEGWNAGDDTTSLNENVPTSLDSVGMALPPDYDQKYYGEYLDGLSQLKLYGVYPKANIDPKDVRGDNWMGFLEDSTKIKHLSIPGSHDATTYNVSFYEAPWSQDQTLDIEKQCKWGSRFFDVRCGVIANIKKDLTGFDYTMITCHGPVNCNVMLFDCIEQIVEFLKEHPSEGVFLNITATSVNTEEQRWIVAMKKQINIIKEEHLDQLFMEPSDEMTVGDMRGKICVLWDDWQNDTFKDFFKSHSSPFGTGNSHEYDIVRLEPDRFTEYLNDNSNYSTKCQDGSTIRHIVQNIWENLVYDPDRKEYTDYLFNKIELTRSMWQYRRLGLSNDLWQVHFISGCDRCDVGLTTGWVASRLNRPDYFLYAAGGSKDYRSVPSPILLSMSNWCPLGILPMDFVGTEKYSWEMCPHPVFGRMAPPVVWMHNFFGANKNLYAWYLSEMGWMQYQNRSVETE